MKKCPHYRHRVHRTPLSSAMYIYLINTSHLYMLRVKELGPSPINGSLAVMAFALMTFWS